MRHFEDINPNAIGFGRRFNPAGELGAPRALSLFAGLGSSDRTPSTISCRCWLGLVDSCDIRWLDVASHFFTEFDLWEAQH